MSDIVGTPRALKLLNRDIILNTIRENGPITKPEISRITNLSLVTVNKTVEKLVQENYVKVSGVNESTGGRRAQFFEINEKLNYIIGLYYQQNAYVGAIANTIGEIIYEQEFELHSDDENLVMQDTFLAIDELLAKCKDHNVAAIGIGVPGVVKRGVVSNIPNIPSWEGKNVAKIIHEKYKITVFLENDINLATVGLYYNKYQGQIDNLALVYLEQGIGSGLVINGELFKGSTNFAGELSYIPLSSALTIAGQKTKYKGNFENKLTILSEFYENCPQVNKEEIKEMLLKAIADGLMSIICVINPDIIALKLDKVNAADMKRLSEIINERIDLENIPKIVKMNDLKESSLHGLMNMCIRETMPTYQLTSGKRGRRD